MKKNKKIIAILFVVLLFSSCKKKANDGPTYTITGHIYEDCNMQPVVNTYVDLLKGGSGYLANTTTDGTGYFKLEFKDNSVEDQKIRINGAGGYNEIMIDIPWRTSIDNLVLFKSTTTNIKVSLNVINPHTQNDTLVIGDFRTLQNSKFQGPFSSGILYVAANFPLLIQHYNGENKSLYWYFNTFTGTQLHQDFVIDKYCNDTIFVSADIN